MQIMYTNIRAHIFIEVITGDIMYAFEWGEFDGTMQCSWMLCFNPFQYNWELCATMAKFDPPVHF